MDPNMQLFVVKCSKVLLLCRYLPWRPGVLNLASFTWVSHRIGVSLDTKCFHFGAFYVPWGILWPEETFLWQQIRPPPHQETSVTHCTGRTQLWPDWPRQRWVSSKAKALSNPELQMHQSFPSWLKCISWYKSLAQRGTKIYCNFFQIFYNNLPAGNSRVAHLDQCIFRTWFGHFCIWTLIKLLSWLHCDRPFQGCLSLKMKLCRVLGEMNENVPSSHSERRRPIKQRPNPTAGPKKLFWDIITHNIEMRQKKFTRTQIWTEIWDIITHNMETRQKKFTRAQI